ncbi:MAG: 2-hydroxyacid dehydrogenase, partial [Blastocatellia bacterium]
PMVERKKRVFATADIGKAAMDRLRSQGYEVEVYPDIEAPPKSLIIEKINTGIDALITSLRDRVDEDVLRAGAGKLKILSQCAVGFDNIDRAAANRYGIPFTNTPNVLTEATAEFALFMMGAVSRRLYSSERLVDELKWGSWHFYHPFLGDEVTGKTVAVVGAGRIGKAFARKCVGLEMDILLVNRGASDDRFLDYLRREMALRYEAEFVKRLHVAEYLAFDEALERADYVSLHVPLIRNDGSSGVDDTYHLMNGTAFERMRRTAYLINTSRGPVVDEKALYEALVAGKIAGAALDVFEKEPLSPDSPLRDAALKDRLRLFHHFASGTKETRLSPDPEIGMAGLAVQAVIDVLEGRFDDIRSVPNLVNREVV